MLLHLKNFNKERLTEDVMSTLYVCYFMNGDNKRDDVHVTKISIHEFPNKSAIVHFADVFTAISQATE